MTVGATGASLTFWTKTGEGSDRTIWVAPAVSVYDATTRTCQSTSASPSVKLPVLFAWVVIHWSVMPSWTTSWAIWSS